MTEPESEGTGGKAVWVAGLVVVLAAGAATAHGLYEVALGSRTPAVIAWLYPVITDGLALVAYAASSRLDGAGRRYAWAVVVLAAGLSGLAQATYLAGAVGSSPPSLRFGVGAWPAVAAAIAAHLLFLIGTSRSRPPVSSYVQPEARPTVQPDSRPTLEPGVQHETEPRVQPVRRLDARSNRPTQKSDAVNPRDRALAVARQYERRTGRLPAVRDLQTRARVSRGTAATALQELRATRNGLHVINETSQEGPSA